MAQCVPPPLPRAVCDLLAPPSPQDRSIAAAITNPSDSHGPSPQRQRQAAGRGVGVEVGDIPSSDSQQYNPQVSKDHERQQVVLW